MARCLPNPALLRRARLDVKVVQSPAEKAHVARVNAAAAAQQAVRGTASAIAVDAGQVTRELSARVSRRPTHRAAILRDLESLRGVSAELQQWSLARMRIDQVTVPSWTTRAPREPLKQVVSERYAFEHQGAQLTPEAAVAAIQTLGAEVRRVAALHGIPLAAR